MPASSSFRTVRWPRARSSRPVAGAPTRDGAVVFLAAAFGTPGTLPDLTLTSGSILRGGRTLDSGAGLSRSVVVGLNHTRRDEHLWRDIEHTHVGLIVTEERHLELLATIDDKLPPTLVVGRDLSDALDAQSTDDAGLEPDVNSRWA